MSGNTLGNVTVLTRCGRLPAAADFSEHPDLALLELRTEALRISAEALICLTQALGNLVGDSQLDRTRIAALKRRAGDLQGLLAQLRAIQEGSPVEPSTSTPVGAQRSQRS